MNLFLIAQISDFSASLMIASLGILVGQVFLLTAWYWLSPASRKVRLSVVGCVLSALCFVVVEFYGRALIHPFTGPVGKSYIWGFYFALGIVEFVGVSFVFCCICKLANRSIGWGSLGLQTIWIGIGVMAIFLLAAVGNSMTNLDPNILLTILLIPLSIFMVSASLPLLACKRNVSQTFVTLVIALLLGTVALASALEFSPQFNGIDFLNLLMRSFFGIIGMVFPLVLGFCVMRSVGYRFEAFKRWVSLDLKA